MNLFETINKTEHEEVVYCHNKDAGLKAIIAIHNTSFTNNKYGNQELTVSFAVYSFPWSLPWFLTHYFPSFLQ